MHRDPAVILPPIQTVSLNQFPPRRHASMPQPGPMTPSARPLGPPSPAFAKIDILNQVAVPMKISQGEARGLVIAVEGDKPGAAHAVADWLGKYLGPIGGNKDRIHVMDGPAVGETVFHQEQLFDVVKSWHGKNRQVLEILRGAPAEDVTNESDGKDQGQNASSGADRAKLDASALDTSVKGELPPIVIFRNYLLNATDTAAGQLQLRDLYGVDAHWNWTACLWRGLIGPDLVVYVRDTDSRDLDSIDILNKPHALVVPRSKSSPAAIKGAVGGVRPAALRRLGFEVREWLVGVHAIMCA